MAIVDVGMLLGIVQFISVIFYISAFLTLIRVIGKAFGMGGEETFSTLGDAAGAGATLAGKGAVKGGKYGKAFGKSMWNRMFGKKGDVEGAQQATAAVGVMEKDREQLEKGFLETKERADRLSTVVIGMRGKIVEQLKRAQAREDQLEELLKKTTDSKEREEIYKELEAIADMKLRAIGDLATMDIDVLKEVENLEEKAEDYKKRLTDLAARAQILRNRSRNDMRAAATTTMKEGRAAARAADDMGEGAEAIKKDFTKEVKIIDECPDIAIRLRRVRGEISQVRDVARVADTSKEVRLLSTKIDSLRAKEELILADLDGKMSALMRVNPDIAKNFRSRVAPAGEEVLRLIKETKEPLKIAKALAEQAYAEGKKEEKEGKEFKGAIR